MCPTLNKIKESKTNVTFEEIFDKMLYLLSMVVYMFWMFPVMLIGAFVSIFILFSQFSLACIVR